MTRVDPDRLVNVAQLSMPIRPMLASPMKAAVITDWSDWWLERKYDGHRIIVQVEETDVKAWARPRRSTGEMLRRTLPPPLVASMLETFMPGVYDGELIVDIADGISSDVTRKDLADARHFVVFDVLAIDSGEDMKLLTNMPYVERHAFIQRSVLNDWDRSDTPDNDPLRVRLSPYISLATPMHLGTPLTYEGNEFVGQKLVERFVANIWDRGGEGAILKRGKSVYAIGKRNADWVKIKRQEHDALTVVGFKPSRGTVRFPGHPFAIVRVRDDDGNETTVKTKDDYELRKFEKQYRDSAYGKDNPLYIEGAPHPAIGRKLVIEHFGRTRENGYRGPVTWDRWEDE